MMMMMMNTPPQPLLWLVYGSAPVQIKAGTNRHTIAATAVVPSSGTVYDRVAASRPPSVHGAMCHMAPRF